MTLTQEKAIRQHGENLNYIFYTGIDPVELCKKLRRLENKAHRLALDYCNGDNGIDGARWEKESDKILATVNKILSNSTVPVFINPDARGYTLKIRDNFIRKNNIDIYRDMGGYGILAPEVNKTGE